jgi:hypothetical protein
MPARDCAARPQAAQNDAAGGSRIEHGTGDLSPVRVVLRRGIRSRRVARRRMRRQAKVGFAVGIWAEGGGELCARAAAAVAMRPYARRDRRDHSRHGRLSAVEEVVPEDRPAWSEE